jgi:uncharacterized membrane protein YdjX (TVP38/TMEM64 family)
MKKSKTVKFIITTIVLVIFAAVVVLISYAFKKIGSDPEEWANYLRSFGFFSGFVLLFFQVAQVFVAIIPGEIIEIVSGYIFNPLIACLICYVGVFLASALIFFMVKKLGRRFSSLFVSEEKLRTLRFINTKEKLKRTTFLLFLIPGTPKDLMTYFFALSPIKYSDFFVITSFARFPSIISSVIGGSFIGEGEYIKAIVVFVITATISVLGLIIYDIIKKRLEKRKFNTFCENNFSSLLKRYKLKNNRKYIKNIIKRKKLKIIYLKIKSLKKQSVYKPTKVLKAPILLPIKEKIKS